MNQSDVEFTQLEQVVLHELFVRGVAIVGMPADITSESLLPILKAGFEASQRFALELIAGDSDRAQMAYDILAAEIYGRCTSGQVGRFSHAAFG